MRVLITGGAGFIGSAFVRQAVKEGWNVGVLDALTYAGDLERLKEVEGKYTFYKVNLVDRESVFEVFEDFRPEVVVHFAAESHVDRSILDPLIFIKSNVEGTLNLLDASKEFKVERFINISTDEVYGELGEEGYFTEETPLNPNSPYSASKASADMLGRVYFRTYKLPVITVRPSNNYGPWQYPEKLIPVVILKALKDEPIPVYGTGMNIRQWLYVEDCAEAVIKIVKGGKEGEIYNVAGTEEKRNIEVVKTILNILNKPESLITFVKDRPGHDYRYCMKAEKIKKDLGWESKVSFEEGIKLTVEWYSNHLDWVSKKRKGDSSILAIGISNMKKILITGAGGQLGKAFVKFFSSKGIDFVAFERKDLDITNFEKVYTTLEEIKPSVVINCSAYNQVDLAETEIFQSFSTNAVGPYNLAIACKEINAKLIHYSTDYVFDGTKKGLYAEEDLPNPLSQYARSKLLGEDLVKHALEDYLIFRVSWVYGEGKQNFVYKLLQWAREKEFLQVAFNEVSVPTYTDFIVEKTLKALEKDLTGLYHLVPRGYASRYEWAKLSLKLFGIKIVLIPVQKEIFNLPAKRPDFSPMSCDKIEKELGEEFEEWDGIFRKIYTNLGGLA